MKISYNDDEVKIFHPAIAEALTKYMLNNGLDLKYEIEHHPNISNVMGIPDFIIKQKSNGKWVFVVEVKRTPNDTKSPEFWSQGRKYVLNNPNWDSNSLPNFVITNIETTCFLQNSPEITDQTVTQCLIPPGIVNTKTKFGETQNDEQTVQEFSNNVVPKFFELLGQSISTKTLPVSAFAQNFNQILKEFVETYNNLHFYTYTLMSEDKLWLNNFGFVDENDFNQKMEMWRNLHDPQSSEFSLKQFTREFSLDVLFRLFVCAYNKEYFSKKGLFSSTKFPLKIQLNNIQEFIDTLTKIDFETIFDTQTINFIPNNVDLKNFSEIDNFLKSLNEEMKSAISNEAEPDYVLNRIVSNELLFPRKFLNEEGKVMTDPRLANFLTTMCFELTEKIPDIFDPGCGTCNFLSYSYDQIKSKNPKMTHNEILSHLHGCEIDNLLGKLGIFGLLMKNPSSINPKTKLDVRLIDFFEIPSNDFKQYDVMMMNPPFIRPDNKRTPLDKDSIHKKISQLLGINSFMETASQPNLFFYFVELATYLLKENGIAAFILPQSFLNTDNGKIIKEFLLKKFEILYLVTIPASFFFQNLDISPCVLILRRSDDLDKKNKIIFARLTDSRFFDTDVKSTLDDIDDIKFLQKKEICQNEIGAESNWREFILPEIKYVDILKNSSNFKKISDYFTVKRGELANQGSGNSWFFPWSTNTVKGYKNFGKDFHTTIQNIETSLIQFGLKNSDMVSNCVLSRTDIEKQKSLRILNSDSINNLPGLKKFKKKFEKNKHLKLPNTWKSDEFTSNAQIIIPRNLRKNLFVNFNPFWNSEEVYFSTNFILLFDCTLQIPKLTTDEILKFASGFFNSSFVQIMMEKDGNNRESTRKIEKEQINNLPFPVTSLASHTELIKKIGNELTHLPFGLTGEELPGKDNPRFALDMAVAKLLLKIEPNMLSLKLSSTELALSAESDLKTLVEIRKER